MAKIGQAWKLDAADANEAMGEISVQASMEAKLRRQFSPIELVIVNESGRHAGHGSRHGGVVSETGETHFRVKIVSEQFAGMSLPERHRAVYQVLAEELKGSVHALALATKTSAENSRL